MIERKQELLFYPKYRKGEAQKHMMRKTKRLGWILIGLIVLTGCSSVQQNWVMLETLEVQKSDAAFQGRIKKILAQGWDESRQNGLDIAYPYDNAVFPPEIAAPAIIWNERNATAEEWLIVISFAGSETVFCAFSTEKRWQPQRAAWDKMKILSQTSTALITILGLDKKSGDQIVSKNSLNFTTSKDPVGASVFFRQVPLPFSNDFAKVQWRLGDIASSEKPKVVMKNIGICASCHVFSSDGRYLSMEMNYGQDGGAQFFKKVEKNMVLTRKDFFSWSDFPKRGVLPDTRGLFGKMSPSGRYAVASVNEISLALITNNPGFSQVFFPTYGILASYSIQEKRFTPLPGADDFDFVHANPNWSPDDKQIVFARAKTKNEVHDDITNVSPMFKDADIHELNARYNIQFDLYTIPFNDGSGGTAIPLQGASGNNMSNYFARYSPDGKWIVFTQSRTGIMLQPDSELYIIPATGGTARRMNCNRKRFNSWHSWSPNGKWLLFSSKANTPFTKIFVTHIDVNGNDSQPVLLANFSDPDFAANVPEFVNIPIDAIDSITVH